MICFRIRCNKYEIKIAVSRSDFSLIKVVTEFYDEWMIGMFIK